MNIYFSGIGGVAIGPLAEIALDAGYQVQGSDAVDSLVVEELLERGIAVNIGQDGTYLQACHDALPIDLFVHTAALPDDHPELVLAKQLGIRTAKRDELIAQIIHEHNLELIAVCGTHGKTTTTGMLIWALQQLDLPVSYSVGTTLEFGPSGHFEPDSEYFVYECDEFDRNMLHFHPYLSLIPSIDYDHSDTYKTPGEYLEAFRQFGEQSVQIIAWQDQHGELFAGHPDANILTEINDINIPGKHNRRNATLVMQALEELGVDGDYQAVLETFPGTNRRFEKLADNLYTDYGHHPVEIAATLELARELSDHVVLVYQPHQNIRQHELLGKYTSQFERAEEIYWLPTYLSREDPSLSILTPQELTATITNKAAIHIVEFDDALWNAIHTARDAGKLVVCMGAGTIDSWVRKQLTN